MYWFMCLNKSNERKHIIGNHMTLLETKNLSKTFGTLKAVSNVSFKVEDEIVSIIGPSGSGKSTLLRLLSNLETPDEGQIYLFGQEVTALNSKDKLTAYKQLQFIFQDFALFDHLSVYDNITLAPIKVFKKDKKQVMDEALSVLKDLGLSDKINSYPSTLSGGQKQRVAIARAIMANPKIMLFDEPTSALDMESIDDLKKIILDLKQKGIGILVVTHDVSFARSISERLLFMENSSIIYNVSLDNITDHQGRLDKYLK